MTLLNGVVIEIISILAVLELSQGVCLKMEL